MISSISEVRGNPCRLRFLAAAIAAGFLGLAGANAHADTCAAGSTITTTEGAACGVGQTYSLPGGSSKNLFVYRGLPYAKPPTPENGLRWKPPVAPDPWGGTRQAVAFGNECPQMAHKAVAGAEDCLYLNVWTPAGGGSGLPVMVFIHGGAFVMGAGSLGLYDGAYLAASGNQVVVTLNYRLGALGFLTVAGEDDQSADLSGIIPANLALMDQQAALRWVQGNIAAFGGDPAKVTIFGESAGAMSVGFHLFSMPSSVPLFRAGIMESNPMAVEYRTPVQAQKDGDAFVKLLAKAGSTSSFTTIEDFQKPSLEEVMAAQTAYSGLAPTATRILRSGFPEALPWTPVVDGSLVTGQPFLGYADDSIPAKPYIFGVNAEEGAFFGGLACVAASTTKSGDSDPGKAKSCLMPNGKVSTLNAATYEAIVAGLFGMQYKKMILALPTYNPLWNSSTDYYNATAATIAKLGTDEFFTCGNIGGANNVLAQNRGQPAYGYYFQQPPAYDLAQSYGTEACSPASGNTCHGAELDYVFNTLGNHVSPVPQGDAAVAQAMGAAWTSFAADLSMPSGWQPYTRNGAFYVFGDKQGGPAPSSMLASLGDKSHCAPLWNFVNGRLISSADNSASGTYDASTGTLHLHSVQVVAPGVSGPSFAVDLKTIQLDPLQLEVTGTTSLQ